MKPRARMMSLLLSAALATTPTLAAAASYDEAVNGDLSGVRSAPSSLALEAGSNPISGVTIAGDLDYLTLHVASGYALSQLVMTSFVSADNLAFMAIQSGTQFTEPNDAANVANLLGWTHVGPEIGAVGTDYLALMGGGSGAIGYTGPLPSGDYTLWIQQTNAQSVAYTFNAVVAAPEPSTLALLAFGIAALGVLRLRRVT